MDALQAKRPLSKAFTCPVCLRNSHLPAILQCMHYICRECLSQEDATGTIVCSFCDTKEPIKYHYQEHTVTDAEEIPCGPCQSEHPKQVYPANFQCLDCGENLCEMCSSAHTKFKVTKQHCVVKLGQDIPVLKRKIFCGDCKENVQREVEFICKDHESRCCGTCAIRIHKLCNVHDINDLVERIKSESLVDDLKLALDDSKIKIQTIVIASKENVTKLEDQVDEIRKTIGDMRLKLNALIDNFESEIIVKSRRILEKEKDKNNEQIKTCLRFTTAIEHSSRMFDEAVDTAPNLNFYEIFKKVEHHSIKYASFISETLEEKSFTELELAINNKLTDVINDGNIGMLLEKEQNSGIAPVRKKTIKRTKVVRAVANPDGKIPRYSSAAYLPNGNMILVDCNNKRCGLFDSSFQILDIITFRSCPWTTVCINPREFAVTLPLENKIQFYMVQDNKLKSSKCISTALPYWGVAPADEENLAVSIDCKGRRPSVGIISSGGDEVLHFQADESEINFGAPWQFDFDVKRSRFLISSQDRDSVVCMNTRGRTVFEYKHENLRNPAGITHDGDGNVYVCGLKSHNIHQITPNGELMRIIAVPNLKTPFSICFCEESEEFLVTTVDNREEIQIFSLI